MIAVDCEQMSEEWFAMRAGIPTASSFDKIFTSTGKKSTQADAYMNTLVAEWLTGGKAEGYTSDWMARGIEMEAEARAAYEFITESEVSGTGIVFKDEDRLASCSPDGLLINKGLEIKCPAPGTHVGYLMAGKLPTTYVSQVQGSMWVTGFESWDFVSYCPGIKPVIITVNRDDKLMGMIDDIMAEFLTEMLVRRQKLQGMAA